MKQEGPARRSIAYVMTHYPRVTQTFIAREIVALRDADIVPNVWTEVYLPPHLLNSLSVRGTERLLRITNTAAGSLPWIRYQGGLLLFSGRKESRSS